MVDRPLPPLPDGHSARRLEMLFLPVAAALINTERRPPRKLWIGIGVSAIAHVLLLLLMPPPVKQDPQSAAASPMVVQLAAPPAASTETVEIRPAPASKAPPPMMTAPARNPRTASVPLQPPPVAEMERPRTPVPPRPDDFASVLEARRAQRLANEEALVRSNAEARAAERGSDGAGAGSANAQRNLSTLSSPRSGTGGVFEILDKGHRRAQFAFNGWNPGASSSRWREVIEVDAGPQGDIDRAIIRRMIELIRKYHKGSFNWESNRLGRVVKLSARLEDNDGLETFMMREFFGDARQP